MKILIFANGIIHDYTAIKNEWADDTYIIACDGGLRHCCALGIQPNCLLGDMDSVPADMRENFTGKLIPFPSEKNDTDLGLAMTYAIGMLPEEILILGALGGRYDHALANFHALATAAHAGIAAEIKDEKTSVRLIKSSLQCKKHDYDTISLIPLTTEVTGVVTEHLYYPLNGETLYIGTTRGISNRFTGSEASISLSQGLLLIICSKKEEERSV